MALSSMSIIGMLLIFIVINTGSMKLLELYSLIPKTNAIIHSHCSRMTYDHRMQQSYASEEYVRYGIFGEANKIINV